MQGIHSQQRDMGWAVPFLISASASAYAAARLFLRKVGGGYVFVHRTIMEHFASLTDEDVARITTMDSGK